MKSKMTKLVSLLIIFSMCISLCAVSTVSGAEAPETAMTDTQTVLAAEYEEEINVLSYLGIIDSDIDLVNAITRAEFAEMALALANISVGTYDNTKFYDVTPGTAQSNVIMTAAEAGIVRGGDSSMFAPDKNITVEEAVTMIMRAMGYENMALLRYPSSSNACVQYARNVGLLKTSTAENLKGVDAVKLMFDALELGCMEISGATTDGGANYTISDTTYLEEVFGLTRYIGIVTGTEYSKRIAGEGAYENVIEIDNVNYSAEISNAYDPSKILGKNVYWYGKEVDGSIVAVLVGERADRNTSVTILPEDYIYGSDTIVRYWNEKDKEVTAKLSSSARIYYNDKRCFDVTNADFDVADGEIVLLDNNNDKAYDYVFIREYERYCVGNSSYGIITSYYDDWRFNSKENDNWLIYNNGVELTTDHISQWYEVKVMESKDGSFGIIEACKNTYEGEVTKVTEKDGKKYVTINNIYSGEREFELENYYVDAYESKRTGVYEPVKGVSYIFLYNNEGRIYGVSKATNKEYEYGFLIKAAKSGGLDATYQIKIFGEFGSMKVYDLADNFKINGRKVKGDQIAAALATNDNNGQMVMFKKTEDGKLAEVLTYTDKTNGAVNGYDLNAFSLDAKTTASNWSVDRSSYNVQVNGVTYRIPPSVEVPMFYIPADRSDDESYLYYSVQSSTDNITNANNYVSSCDVEIFDTIRYDEATDFSKLSCMTVYAQPEQLSPVTPYILSGMPGEYYVVRGLEEVVDAEGNPRWQLLYSAPTGDLIQKAYFADTVYNVDTNGLYGFGNYKIEDIKEGQIIKFAYKNDHATVLEINRFAIVGDPSRYEDFDYLRVIYEKGKYDYYDPATLYYWTYGNVIYYDEDEMVVQSYDAYTTGAGTDKFISFRVNGDIIWQYNIKTGSMDKITNAAITRGDRIFLRGRYETSGLFSAVVRIVEE